MNVNFLDTSGLRCPMPVIKMQQLVRKLASGDLVELKTTDPAAEKDIHSWCKINKHQLLSIEKFDDHLIIKVQVG